MTTGLAVDHYGMIIMLDVLGARKNSIEESRIILNKIEDVKKKIFKLVNCLSEKADIDYRYYKGMKHYVLGDTFIITTDSEHFCPGEIVFYNRLMMDTVFQCVIEEQLRVRGSVSVGKYLCSEDGRTLVGPAISDAAQYHEKASWTGLILTPETGISYEEYCCSQGKGRFYIDDFVKYSVPFKCGYSQKLWCLPWPLSMVPGKMEDFDYIVGEGYRGCFSQAFQENAHKLNSDEAHREAMEKFINPKEDPMHKDKYDNTVEFYNFVLDFWNTNEKSYVDNPDIFFTKMVRR